MAELPFIRPPGTPIFGGLDYGYNPGDLGYAGAPAARRPFAPAPPPLTPSPVEPVASPWLSPGMGAPSQGPMLPMPWISPRSGGDQFRSPRLGDRFNAPRRRLGFAQPAPRMFPQYGDAVNQLFSGLFR